MSEADVTLLEGFAASRSEDSFRRLYRRHTPVLYALALRLSGGSASDAEELVQEAWVRGVERLEGFGGRSSLRTWLSGILINCFREQRRRRARAPRPLDEGALSAAPAGASVTAFPARRLRADPEDVERALARLPDGYREVVVLFDVNGYTHREIAELLGIEEGTSKSQLARGRARLRELLTGPATTRGREERGRP